MGGADISRADDHSSYFKGDVAYPPVSKVLKLLEVDQTGLEIWRGRNDGEGDNAHHTHIFWYSRHRGTLAHYEALDPLTDEDLWGYEESDSMQQILTGPSDEAKEEFWDNGASLDMDDIVYSIMVNHERRYPFRRTEYDANTLLSEILHEDVEWFYDRFQELRFALGISDDAVLDVEEYVVEEEHGYGGQADLVYEDPSGNVVLADLKTSSSLRHKHRLQAVGYMRAMEAADYLPYDDIDRVEIIRATPDKEEYQVHSYKRPDHIPDDAEWYETDDFFVDPWGDFEYEDIDAMWAKFTSLVDEWHKYNDDEGTDEDSSD